MINIKFPTATHSYFKIMNLEEQRVLFFLGNSAENPVFTYRNSLNAKSIAKRLEKLEQLGINTAQFKIIQAGITLQASPSQDTSIEIFRQKNSNVYGEPSVKYSLAILKRIKNSVHPDDAPLWDYIAKASGYNNHNSLHEVDEIWPSDELFQTIREHGRVYMRDLIRSDHTLGLVQLLKITLDSSGLTDKGWVLKLKDDASAAHVSHTHKYLTVGVQYRPRNRRATYRVIAHEVYGHITRGAQPTARESEGFAVLLEQLLDNRFKPRRMYRYLAAALAWGALTEAMDFRQTFEIIWRCMVVLSKYTIDDAKKYAFYECARVFRGGRPDIPGAVYLKDTLYFSANIDFWRAFNSEPISYNEFMNIAYGTRQVLT